jgi:hypothetical protein
MGAAAQGMAGMLSRSTCPGLSRASMRKIRSEDCAKLLSVPKRTMDRRAEPGNDD